MNPSHTLQSRFLALLPRIERYARFHFRGVRCANRKADRIAEVIALAWKWFLRLAERGKDVTQFLTVFVNLAVRSVRSGRRLAGITGNIPMIGCVSHGLLRSSRWQTLE